MNIDEMIAAALEEEFEERVEQCLSDTSKHKFSLAYRLWEYKALKNLGKNRRNDNWTLRRARRIVTAAIIAASALLLTITAYAALMSGRFSFDEKREYSKMFIENLSSDKTTIEELYGLPEEEGWVLVDYDIVPTMGATLTYQRGDAKVDFDQNIIHNGNMGYINTEKVSVEPISLYEENDGFILDFGTNGCSLWWIYDGYLFELHGNFNKNDTMNLAYSTKIIDFPEKF